MSVSHEQSYTVGQRIARLRQRAGMSSRELAERLGWPRDTLVNYELGRRAITIERLMQIADALTVPPAALLVEDDRLAALLPRLATNPTLVAQVDFFLTTLDDELPEEQF
jgi:transcriptional regulator with XRE-family HTH domain